MTTVSGFNVNDMFSKMTDSIAKKGQALETKMNELSSKDSISSEEMLAIQFEMNQYNTLLESTSTIAKSITDEAKQLAQRSN